MLIEASSTRHEFLAPQSALVLICPSFHLRCPSLPPFFSLSVFTHHLDASSRIAKRPTLAFPLVDEQCTKSLLLGTAFKMIIYKDVLSGDEIISDSYDLKNIDDIVYEIDCAMITMDAVQVNIGANASAEEAEEALEDTSKKVNNVINSFRLQETPPFDKQEYVKHLKKYMKDVKAYLAVNNPDEVPKFEAGAQKYVKNVILKNFKDWEFYMGESMSDNGMIVLLNYREDGVTPYVVIWKHGLIEEKV